MIVMNVTMQIDEGFQEPFRTWLAQVYVTHALASGCFTKATVLRLLQPLGAPTYAVHFFADGRADCERFLKIHAPDIDRLPYEKWGDACVSFRTPMEVVQ